MIQKIPGFHDYVREKEGPIGRCLACGHEGAMQRNSTGYECAKCHSMKLELKLQNGGVYRQFR